MSEKWFVERLSSLKILKNWDICPNGERGLAHVIFVLLRIITDDEDDGKEDVYDWDYDGNWDKNYGLGLSSLVKFSSPKFFKSILDMSFVTAMWIKSDNPAKMILKTLVKGSVHHTCMLSSECSEGSTFLSG